MTDPTLVPAAAQPSLDALVEQAVVRHDANAWGELYDRFVDPIYRYVYVFVGPGAEAEKLTESVFIQAWQQSETLPSHAGAFVGWLYDLARQVRREHLGHARASRWLFGAEGDPVATAFDRVPAEGQEVLLLRFFGRLGRDETALVMNTPTETVIALELQALETMAALIHAADAADPNRPGVGGVSIT